VHLLCPPRSADRRRGFCERNDQATAPAGHSRRHRLGRAGCHAQRIRAGATAQLRFFGAGGSAGVAKRHRVGVHLPETAFHWRVGNTVAVPSARFVKFGGREVRDGATVARLSGRETAAKVPAGSVSGSIGPDGRPRTAVVATGVAVLLTSDDPSRIPSDRTRSAARQRARRCAGP
jgi:hypothetical protein